MAFSNRIWSELALLKDPVLRILLSQGLYALSAYGERKKLWEAYLSSVRGPEGKRALMLIAIPLSNLQLQGIEGSKILSVANHLSALQKKNDSSFRNVYQVKTFAAHNAFSRFYSGAHSKAKTVRI